MTSWALLIFGCAIGWALLFRPTWIGGGRRFPGSTALGFLFLVVGMTSPMAIAPEALPLDSRDGTDVFLSVWNLWNTHHALASGVSPYVAEGIFLPGGADLSLHRTSVTYGVLSAPFQVAFGEHGPPQLFGVYTLLVIGSFWLAAYFMFRLAFLLTQSRSAAILAAIVFAFADFRFANLVRLDVLATEWLVLFVWSWISFLRRPRPLKLVGLAVSALLLLHSSRDYTVQAGIVIGIWTFFDLVTGRAFRARREELTLGRDAHHGRRVPPVAHFRSKAPLGSLGWGVASCFALLLAVVGSYPWAVRALGRLRWAQSAGTGWAEESSADLSEFFLPSSNHPLWGGSAASWVESLHFGDDRFGHSLGPLAGVLFVLATFWILRRRSGVRWVSTTLLCLAFALGPVLQLGGETTSIPMPFQGLLAIFPWFAEIGSPTTWMASAWLALSVSVAIGWTHARARLQGRGAGLITVALLLFTLAAPFRLSEEPIPDAYRHVARISRNAGLQPAGLLHLPGMFPRASLLYQTVHGQKVAENVGHASRGFRGSNNVSLDPAYRSLVETLGRDRTLARLSSSAREQVRVETTLFLQRHSIRWIVVPMAVETQAWAVGDIFSPLELGNGLYDNYCENLRALNPVSEVEIGAFTVFQF